MKKELSNAPEHSIALEYVYGYNGRDASNNIHFNSDGKLVYHIAAVGVVMEQHDDGPPTQSFFQVIRISFQCFQFYTQLSIVDDGLSCAYTGSQRRHRLLRGASRGPHRRARPRPRG